MSFFQKLLLFHIPMVLLFAGAVFVAVYSGEAMPPRMAYESQLKYPDAIYLTSNRQKDFHYKYIGYEYVQPDVLMIGSSRILTFRGGFVNRDTATGYNVGIAGGGMPDIEAFIDLLTPETAPEVMVMNIDQFWFNSSWQTFYISRQITLTEIDPVYTEMVTRQVIKTLIEGRLTLADLVQRKSPAYGELGMGIDAILTGIGYTVDGGLQNNIRYQTPEIIDLRRDLAMDDQRESVGQFVQGDSVNDSAFTQLERILDKADALDIKVIAFSPPYMPSIYKAMMDGGKHTYIEAAMMEVQELFDRRDIPFFDFTDVSDFSTDYEMRDGNHPSELLSLRMYMKMVEGAPEVLGAYSDLEGLQALIDNAPNPHEVVPRITSTPTPTPTP